MSRSTSPAYLLVLALATCAVVRPGCQTADPPAERRRREEMVARQIESRGITDPLVLQAMRSIPRHQFVPADLRDQAYSDYPLPIGEGQTISQPYIVALMTQELTLEGHEKVLEVGTGSGYQAAVLHHIVAEVYTMEIKPILYERTAALLEDLGLDGISTLSGDGYWGWKEHAPFDCIMITAAVDHIPRPLYDQLATGGRLVLPLGHPFQYQNLVLVTKTDQGPQVKIITGVRFVPMTGEALQ